MNTLRRAMLTALLLFVLVAFLCCGARTGPRVPVGGGGIRNCCNAPTSFGPIQIAGRADQVPNELQGCGVHREEITAIVISGMIRGCAGDTSNMSFSNLHLEFTTDGARCGGQQGVRTSLVDLANVDYSGRLRLAVAPPCVADSSVAMFDISRIDDSGYHTLFVTNGRATLKPILNHLVLRWAGSPPGTCPPSPGLGTTPGNTLGCPG